MFILDGNNTLTVNLCAVAILIGVLLFCFVLLAPQTRKRTALKIVGSIVVCVYIILGLLAVGSLFVLGEYAAFFIWPMAMRLAEVFSVSLLPLLVLVVRYKNLPQELAVDASQKLSTSTLKAILVTVLLTSLLLLGFHTWYSSLHIVSVPNFSRLGDEFGTGRPNPKLIDLPSNALATLDQSKEFEDYFNKDFYVAYYRDGVVVRYTSPEDLKREDPKKYNIIRESRLRYYTDVISGSHPVVEQLKQEYLPAQDQEYIKSFIAKNAAVIQLATSSARQLGFTPASNTQDFLESLRVNSNKAAGREFRSFIYDLPRCDSVKLLWIYQSCIFKNEKTGEVVRVDLQN